MEPRRERTRRRRRREPFVFEATRGHLRRGRAEVLAGFTIDALALVAPMIDSLRAAVSLEHLVRQRRPPLARVLDPAAAVYLARLRGAAPFWMRAIGAFEPLLPVALDAVVLTFRDHEMGVRIVLPPIAVAAGVDGERVG